MVVTVEEVYDGALLWFTEPVDIPPNTRVRVTIEPLAVPIEEGVMSFLDTARSLNLRGPADWSENVDEYLYHGKPFPDE